MAFWWFIFFCDLLIPLLMLASGLVMWKFAPKRINWWFGYRTARSMKNEDTWRFAHEHCGKLWFYRGLMTLPLCALLHIPFYGKGEDAMGTISMVFMVVQLVVLIASVYPTEIALKKTFDENGTRKG